MQRHISRYLNKEDWRVKENSNQSFSLQGLNSHLSSTAIANYWLDEVYPENIGNAHRSGRIHIHDLSSLSSYCCGWDLTDLLLKGFGGARSKVSSKPAKHLRTALMQMVNFLYTLAGEVAGAVAFSQVDTLMAPFIREDNIEYEELKQIMQEFVFNLNVPTRTGFQSPFSNISLDLTVPNKFKNTPAIVGGKVMAYAYGDLQKEMDMFNKAFAEVMIEGDATGRPFTFPIPTYNITSDFDWENEELDHVWEMTAKYGIPYFANYVNSDLSPDDSRSMCCRLKLKTDDLQYRGGGLFGAAPLTGCYSDDTEIMTSEGWKPFSNLSMRDTVLTRTSDGEIELHKPKKVFVYGWDGDMFHITGRSTDLLVTPNHRMLCVDSKGKNQYFVEAEEFVNADSRYIPRTAKWTGVDANTFILPAIECSWASGNHNSVRTKKWNELEIDMDLWLKFLGIWIAEGSFDNDAVAKTHGYRVFISQTKEESKGKIREMLEEFPFSYNEFDDGFVITNKQLWSYCKNLGHALDKFIPMEFKSLRKEKLETLLEWMVLGDGHVRNTTGQTVYYTASKALADDVQEIVAKIGLHGRIKTRTPRASSINGREILSKNKQYEVYVNKSKTQKIICDKIKKVDYHGNVYCCEVENNTVLVRRNGKTSWCGNSIGVVTINLPKIGWNCKNDRDGFFEELDRCIEIARESLVIKRGIIEDWTEEGLYPYSKNYLGVIKNETGKYWGNHFSTIGIIGMHEACEFLIGQGIESGEGHALAAEVLEFIRGRLEDFQRADEGSLWNLEASPAEGATHRLARIDSEAFGWGDNVSYYTNSTNLPVGHTEDVFKALKHQESLLGMYTGGTVFHTFLGEPIDAADSKMLVKKISDNFTAPYFTLTPTFSICPKDGYMNGEHSVCPKCGAKSDVYSRIVGYLQPLCTWNDGKADEFSDRKEYKC